MSTLASLLSGKRSRIGKSNCWLSADQSISVLSTCIGCMPGVIPKSSWHTVGKEHDKSLAGYWAGCCKVLGLQGKIKSIGSPMRAN